MAVAGLGVALLGALGPATAFAGSPSSSPSPSPSPSPYAASPSPSSSPTPTPTPRPSPSISYKTTATEFSLTISPSRLVIGSADVGRTQQLTAVNRGEQPLTVTVQKRDFLARPDGSLEYKRNARFGAQSWLTVSPMRFVLRPGAVQTLTATIKAPDKTEPGDHQAALVLLVPSGRSAENININRGVGIPMYVTVPGPVDDTVVLTHFSGPRFTAGGHVPLSLSVENRGTVHRDFRGPTAIAVHAAGTPVAFPDFTVPRGASRDTSTIWKPPLACICHPSVSFANADGALQTTTIRVIVFPWPLALGVLAAVLVVLLLLRLRRRRAAPAAISVDASSAVSSGDA